MQNYLKNTNYQSKQPNPTNTDKRIKKLVKVNYSIEASTHITEQHKNE